MPTSLLSAPARSRPIAWWGTHAVVVLGLLSGVLQIARSAPYVAPAGHGASLADAPLLIGTEDHMMMVARPPDVGVPWTTRIAHVVPDSPAARAGLQAGQDVTMTRSIESGRTVDVSVLPRAGAEERLRLWRDAYWAGIRGPVALTIAQPSGRASTIVIERPPFWSAGVTEAWIVRHGGRIAQGISFLAAALILLLLRASDVTARWAIFAFVTCAVANMGLLLGTEQVLPPGLREAITVFAWLALPLAFPTVGLAILHFPSRSPLLDRHPLLALLPFAVIAPTLLLAIGTALFVAGFDAAQGVAVWDATHPRLYYAVYLVGLALNIAAIIEGWLRFQRMRDPAGRRRVQLAFYTTLPGVLAYGVSEGIPAIGAFLMHDHFALPAAVALPLQALILLPAIGVPYAVAVHRVMEPRLVVRRSLQYGLARSTLTVLLLLPAAALAVALVRQRDMTLSMIVSGRPLFYLVTLALLAVGLRYRDTARAWLDRRFFREQYDARQVLLSLAGRIPYETDPNELTALVLQQIDTALHPKLAAVLASGLQEGQLTPVAVLHGTADALSASGGLATLLKWSDEPLEVILTDPRSPARRLPVAEQQWLEGTGVELLVPMFVAQNGERALTGVLALGEKRSEEPYTPEDRELLASIAAQVSLALDVARLRQRQSSKPALEDDGAPLTRLGTTMHALTECPECGRCEDAAVMACPDDRTAMRLVAGLPRLVDGKYRVDRVLGRGGMGAVFRARDMRLDRDVALKIVKADLLSNPDARSRFRREAQVVAKLQHPSIVSIFDYGSLPDGGAFLVMEFVRGRDLRVALREHGSYAPGEAVRLMTCICAAIDAAHATGVLHRDLKPENILLPDGRSDVKVLDFGIAKLVGDGGGDHQEETLTAAGMPLGTPAYMAPEQLAGETVTPQTDLFSLGVLAYELVTGELPFGRGPLLDIAQRQQRTDAGARLAERGVRAGVSAAIGWALKVDPASRPRTAGEFARALDAGLAA